MGVIITEELFKIIIYEDWWLITRAEILYDTNPIYRYPSSIGTLSPLIIEYNC